MPVEVKLLAGRLQFTRAGTSCTLARKLGSSTAWESLPSLLVGFSGQPLSKLADGFQLDSRYAPGQFKTVWEVDLACLPNPPTLFVTCICLRDCKMHMRSKIGFQGQKNDRAIFMLWITPDLLRRKYSPRAVCTCTIWWLRDVVGN